MDRNEKIITLEAIAEGKLKPEDLKPLIGQMFVEGDKPGEYFSGDKKYSQKQLDAHCKKFDQANERRASFGLPEGVMMVVYSSVPIDTTKKEQEPPLQPEPEPESIILLWEEPEETFTEAEITDQETPGKPEKPDIIVDQEKKDKKPVLWRNITDQFLE